MKCSCAQQALCGDAYKERRRSSCPYCITLLVRSTPAALSPWSGVYMCIWMCLRCHGTSLVHIVYHKAWSTLWVRWRSGDGQGRHFVPVCKSGCINYLKIWKPSRNFGLQKGDMKLHTEVPKILGETVQNLVATATRRPGFVHPWCKYICS
jgi:hypothetical protein